MIISARILSRTARCICASVTSTPLASARALILSAAPLISAAACGHSPVSALVRSSDGVGGQVAPDPVGADDHQRADAVEHGALDLRVGHFDALGLGTRLDLVARAFDFGGGLRPFAGEGCGQIIIGGGRPVTARPAWALRLGLCIGGCVAKGSEKGAPCLVDRARILGVLRVKLFKIGRVMALHEAGGVELVVGALVGHGCT